MTAKNKKKLSLHFFSTYQSVKCHWIREKYGGSLLSHLLREIKKEVSKKKVLEIFEMHGLKFLLVIQGGS